MSSTWRHPQMLTMCAVQWARCCLGNGNTNRKGSQLGTKTSGHMCLSTKIVLISEAFGWLLHLYYIEVNLRLQF